MKKLIEYPEIRRLFDKAHAEEIGKALAERHLKMIRDAVKEWAKGRKK